ncbi:hypothetical protein [Thiobacillus sp.]
MSKSRLNLLLLPSMLALALPGWAETRPANAKAAQARPLNLSLPRDVLQAPGSQLIDETVERNLLAPVPSQAAPKAPAHPTILPYGAGYEHRHQDMGGAGAGTGASPASGAGAGRRGR